MARMKAPMTCFNVRGQNKLTTLVDVEHADFLTFYNFLQPKKTQKSPKKVMSTL